MLKGSCDLYVEIEQQSGYPFVNCLRFTLVQKKKITSQQEIRSDWQFQNYKEVKVYSWINIKHHQRYIGCTKLFWHLFLKTKEKHKCLQIVVLFLFWPES